MLNNARSTKASIKAKLRETGIDIRHLDNPLVFGAIPCFDPARDCALELLHDLNLGIIKVVNNATVARYFSPGKPKEHNRDALAAVVDGMSYGGFSVSIRGKHLANYSGSFVGADFERQVQLMPHILRTLRITKIKDVSEHLINVWVELGYLSKLLYLKSWSDSENYFRHLQASCAALENAVRVYDPNLLRSSSKWHSILKHSVQLIRWLGPTVFMRTDNFEHGNAAARNDVEKTSRQALSIDVANFRRKYEGVRAVFLGGWFLDSSANTFVQAGHKVMKMGNFKLVRKVLQGELPNKVSGGTNGKGNCILFDLWAKLINTDVTYQNAYFIPALKSRTAKTIASGI